MMRLRTVSTEMAGWSRRKHGRGFVYLDAGGERLSDVNIERCRELVIPPAWTDVWICPIENGHLQAVGTDDAGRRQYIYHPHWRLRRNREKYVAMLEFAERLPTARRRVSQDLRLDTVGIERAAATAFRLFDIGVFRLGSERYVDENGSYGLLTLERRHVRKTVDGYDFDYVAKSGQERAVTVTDPAVVAAIDAMRLRRAPAGQRLLAYKDGNRWSDVGVEQVTDYIKSRMGDDASAKDFRTWHANVVAAAVLAVQEVESKAARQRAVSRAMREVAEFLGNTAAVARSSYVDPRLVDLFADGTTIDTGLATAKMPRSGEPLSPKLEREVRELLS